MKPINVFKRLTFFGLLLVFATGYGQDLGGIVKRKLKKKAKDNMEKTVDQTMDVIEGKDPDVVGDGPYGEVVVVSRNEEGEAAPIPNFINPGTAIFVDDFDTEKPTEFPSKWTQVSGAVETDQILVNGERDGVLKTISGNSTVAPTIKSENYLGEEFKIEMLLYFNDKGNEAYYIDLKNTTGLYRNHSMRISPNSMWSGSDNISRMPSSHPQQGWHTFQISFNRGHMKAYYDGVMLVNDPDITMDERYPKKMFTNLEVRILSPSVNSAQPLPQLVSYFAIGGKGHDLYKRLVTDGKLVMNNIQFEVNSYTLKPDSYGVLDQLIEMMTAHSEVSLQIHGHTDSDGSNAFNQTLSENRAKTVMTYLTSKGVAGSRLTSTGYGEEKPLDPADTATAKAKNRRVEFVLN